jgi:hypothetical protein
MLKTKSRGDMAELEHAVIDSNLSDEHHVVPSINSSPDENRFRSFHQLQHETVQPVLSSSSRPAAVPPPGFDRSNEIFGTYRQFHLAPTSFRTQKAANRSQ